MRRPRQHVLDRRERSVALDFAPNRVVVAPVLRLARADLALQLGDLGALARELGLQRGLLLAEAGLARSSARERELFPFFLVGVYRPGMSESTPGGPNA